MKTKVYESDIRKAVVDALGHLGITSDDIEMPCRADGPVLITVPRRTRESFRGRTLAIPNWELADIVLGDKWDGDSEDSAFRFGGGGYDAVWFECGVVEK